MDELFKGLDFEKAKPFFQQRWDKLPPDLQTLASQQLGYKQAIWDKGQKPLELKGKRWHKLTEEHKAALSKLGCSKLMYKKDLCHVWLIGQIFFHCEKQQSMSANITLLEQMQN